MGKCKETTFTIFITCTLYAISCTVYRKIINAKRHMIVKLLLRLNIQFKAFKGEFDFIAKRVAITSEIFTVHV